MKRVTILALLLGLVLAACGGDDGLKDDEQAYVDEVREATGEVSDVLGSITDLTGSPRLDDDAWWNEVMAQAAALQVTVDTFDATPPTDRLEDVHDMVVESFAETRQAAERLGTGAEQRSTSIMAESAPHLNRATEVMDDAREEIDDME